MTPAQLRAAIVRLSEKQPITSRLEEALAARRKKPTKAWYRNQREHWLGWLGEYEGFGAYNRKGGHNRDAAYAYNHSMNPAQTLWLGEGAGIAPSLLGRAIEACLQAGPTLPKQCAAVRACIPWSLIEARLPVVDGERKTKSSTVRKRYLARVADLMMGLR